MNDAEKNYAQLEKEGLALVFGIKKFYSYLFGHPSTLSTSPQASTRVKRWSLYFSMFKYELTFRNTTAHGNADALPRLSLPDTTTKDHIQLDLPVSADQVTEATRQDPVLSTVTQYVNQGWPRSILGQPELSSYFMELSIFEGCLLWGSHVILPQSCQEAVLTQLHEGHKGIVRTKSLAKMYVWWPGINNDIDHVVRQCVPCQKTCAGALQAPFHSWSWPTLMELADMTIWARLHLDYAGQVEGKMVIVMVDAHSKWIEAVPTATATSTAVIEVCRERFAQFGLPDTIVTDNGNCFTSSEFATFLQRNGIKHITTAPYHQASNGLAERAVQIGMLD